MAKKLPPQKRRSKFEEKVESILKKNKIKYEYEATKLAYILPSPTLNYIPDFTYDDIIIEVKGWLPYRDQAKMLAVKKAHPHLDIRFVFYDPKKKMPKRKNLTHAEWALKAGFPYTDLEGLEEGVWYGC